MVAIVTGASQGIGECIAKRLAKDGYNVAINCYPSDADKEKAEKLLENGEYMARNAFEVSCFTLESENQQPMTVEIHPSNEKAASVLMNASPTL